MITTETEINSEICFCSVSLAQVSKLLITALIINSSIYILFRKCNAFTAPVLNARDSVELTLRERYMAWHSIHNCRCKFHSFFKFANNEIFVTFVICIEICEPYEMMFTIVAIDHSF